MMGNPWRGKLEASVIGNQRQRLSISFFFISFLHCGSQSMSFVSGLNTSTDQLHLYW